MEVAASKLIEISQINFDGGSSLKAYWNITDKFQMEVAVSKLIEISQINFDGGSSLEAYWNITDKFRWR